jgi:hypothetical protein
VRERYNKEAHEMQEIARHDSSLVTFSSSDAISVDAVYGNGKFSCQLNNVNRGATHAVKVLPTAVLVPNVFPNMKEEDVTVKLYDGSTWNHNGSVSVLPGHYDTDSIAAALSVVDMITLSVSPSGRFLFTVSPSMMADVIEITPGLANMLGLSNNEYTIVGGKYRFACDVDGDSKTVAAAMIPHLGTTPIVYVVARQIGNNNMVASDSKEYDVIATVSMHNAAYGAYASYVSSDVFVDDIDYRTARSINRVDFELLDHNYKPLTIDSRFPVIVQLKVYHVDTVKG